MEGWKLLSLFLDGLHASWQLLKIISLDANQRPEATTVGHRPVAVPVLQFELVSSIWFATNPAGTPQAQRVFVESL